MSKPPRRITHQPPSLIGSIHTSNDSTGSQDFECDVSIPNGGYRKDCEWKFVSGWSNGPFLGGLRPGE
eukprot:60099-Pelagomonas_calceolata.AAC.2